MHNKLDDLFSLTAFLRFYPVDNDSNARRYILDPLGKKDPHVLADLRSIMTTVALRRTRSADQSRRRSERVESVLLSPAERGKYQETLLQARKTLAASTRDTASSSLLGTLLRLRQICSHGIYNIVSNATGSVPKCCQRGDDLPLTQTAPRAVRMGRQDRLCYDCGLAWSDNTSIPAFDILYDTQTGARVDSSAMEIDSGTDTLSFYSDRNESYMIQDESVSKTTKKSSKLEKVLSNLKELQQISGGSQGPVKR